MVYNTDLTPRLCLHLFYIMLLVLFARMHSSGYADTVFPACGGAANVLVVYAVLYGFKTMLPNVPFRLGFPNGLMSESIVIRFSVVYLRGGRLACRQKAEQILFHVQELLRAFLSTSPPYAKRPKGFFLSGALPSHILCCISQT